MRLRIVETEKVRWFRARAITFYPFIFMATMGMTPVQYRQTRTHEEVHWKQQRDWARRAFGLGLVAWYFLYLFALPFWKNPWRQRWESEALKAEGYREDEILEILQRPPYYLWSLKGKKSRA